MRTEWACREGKKNYMEETIKQIKDEFQAATVEMLPDFVCRHAQDTRTAVQDIVRRAQKRLDACQAEVERTKLMYRFEEQYGAYQYICGIDEVGRGPFAGPVVAGAVILPKDIRILELNDSKKLSAGKREELYDVIVERAISYGLGFVGPERIDEINILQATYEAMREAIQKLSPVPDILLNDAVTIPKVEIRQVPIIKGDAKSASIAAASILAKVTRDRLMEEYDKVFPEYHFASNKGYGSREHIEAIQKYGPTPIHRKTFIHNFV